MQNIWRNISGRLNGRSYSSNISGRLGGRSYCSKPLNPNPTAQNPLAYLLEVLGVIVGSSFVGVVTSFAFYYGINKNGIRTMGVSAYIAQYKENKRYIEEHNAMWEAEREKNEMKTGTTGKAP